MFLGIGVFFFNYFESATTNCFCMVFGYPISAILTLDLVSEHLITMINKLLELLHISLQAFSIKGYLNLDLWKQSLGLNYKLVIGIIF